MGEFDLIARYFTRPVRRAALGVGDDCALLAPAPGMQLAVSSDMLVEGRHFFADVPPERLGHKALAVNLSDLAACGARPLAFTLALALPARLAARSRALAQTSSGCLVAVPSRSSPGSFLLAGSVAARGLPVVALACGFPWYCLPPLAPGGHWRGLAKGDGLAAALWVAGQ